MAATASDTEDAPLGEEETAISLGAV